MMVGMAPSTPYLLSAKALAVCPMSLVRARDATQGNYHSDGLVTLPACCACLLAGIGQRRQATRHENALAFRRRCFFGACPMRTGAPWFCDLSPFGASTPVLATWANTL